MNARPRRIANRCPGSLQLVAAWSEHARRAPCPSCFGLTEQVPLDGRMVLVEHRRRSVEALSMALFA